MFVLSHDIIFIAKFYVNKQGVGKTKVTVSKHDSQVTIVQVLGFLTDNIEARLCSTLFEAHLGGNTVTHKLMVCSFISKSLEFLEAIL